MTARLTDIAGNVGANSTATPVTVDAAAPTATVAITAIATDSGASSSDFITNDTTLTVSGTHGALGSGETVQVSSDGGASWADATSTATAWSYTDPTPHGTSFTYQARIVDTVGNVGANTASQAVTIDTVAPTAAVAITAITDDSGTSSSDFITNDTTLTVAGTHGALGPGETVQVSSDGGASWADATSTASTWSYTDPTTHGTSFTYRVRIVDTAGNVDVNTASQAVTIDTAAPAAPSITAIPENGDGGGIDPDEASDGTPVVVGLAGTGAAAGDTLTINWGSQTVNYALLAGDILGNSATVTVPAGTIAAQGLGTFDVTARLTDAAGNASSNSTPISVTVISIDILAPTAAVAITAIATDSGASSSDFITNDTTLTVAGTHGSLGPGETVQVSSDGGASWFNVTTSTASTWSYTDPTTHGTSFTYRVRTIDSVGNVGATTASQAVTIDTVAPGAPSITAIPEDGGGGIDAAEASDGTPVVVGPDRHRGGGGRHADHPLGQPDGQLHAPGGAPGERHLGQQRDGDGAFRDDPGPGPGHVRRDGHADRHSGQCQLQLEGDLGNGRRRPRRRPHGLLRRLDLRFPGRRRLRGRPIDRCGQSLAGPDPDRVISWRHQHHDSACRDARR